MCWTTVTVAEDDWTIPVNPVLATNPIHGLNATPFVNEWNHGWLVTASIPAPITLSPRKIDPTAKTSIATFIFLSSLTKSIAAAPTNTSSGKYWMNIKALPAADPSATINAVVAVPMFAPRRIGMAPLNVRRPAPISPMASATVPSDD